MLRTINHILCGEKHFAYKLTTELLKGIPNLLMRITLLLYAVALKGLIPMRHSTFTKSFSLN